MSEENKRGCEECDWTGWVHSHEPFEIQRCDTCTDGYGDNEAIKFHQQDCGCDWPEMDYQNVLFRRSFFSSNEPVHPELREIMNRFHEVTSFRDLLLVNRYILMSLLGEVFRLPYARWEKQDVELYEIATYLLEIESLVSNGLWKPHWLFTFDEGTVIGEKWFAHKPVRPMNPPPIQSSMSDAQVPDREYLTKFNGYVEKIRALGADITFVHDEYNITIPRGHENTAKVTELALALSQFQLAHQMKKLGKSGPVTFSEGDVQNIWENSFMTPLEQVLRKHAPSLRVLDRAMGEAMRRRPKPELDYKKIYSALSRVTRQSVETNELLEEAKRHLLEIYPDADLGAGT